MIARGERREALRLRGLRGLALRGRRVLRNVLKEWIKLVNRFEREDKRSRKRRKEENENSENT